MTPTLEIKIGDTLSVLKTMASQSVQCIVTSPPYFGLRDYKTPAIAFAAGEYPPLVGLEPHRYPAWKGELGSEPEPLMFVGHIVEIFREARRVLRDNGTLWMNFGDCHVDGGRGGIGQRSTLNGAAKAQNESRQAVIRTKYKGLRPKNLVYQPARVALALQADGWILRRDHIWHKTNPMPESCKDRCTCAHEYMYLFVKGRYYYYNNKAIREPGSPDTHARYARGRRNPVDYPGNQTIAKGFDHMVTAKGDPASEFPGEAMRDGNRRRDGNTPANWDTGAGNHHDYGRHSHKRIGREGPGSHMHVEHDPAHLGRITRRERETGRPRAPDVWTPKQEGTFSEKTKELTDDRNKRTVWSIATEGYKGAHFATFPRDLVRPCVLAGSKAGDVVLDTFGGSGTTGAVALEYGRSCILIDLQPLNEELMRDRISPFLGQSVLPV